MAPGPTITTEGTSANPYGEDLFQHIVDVHWPAPAGRPFVTFVFGGFGTDFAGLGGVYAVKVDKNKLGSLTTIPLAKDFEPVASSYAEVDVVTDPKTGELTLGVPTFLVAGNRTERRETVDSVGNPITVTDFYTVIYYSNDGFSWQVAHQTGPFTPGDPVTARATPATNPVSLVWDPNNQAFFYDANVGTGDAAIPTLNDTIYSSSDGLNWTMVSQTPTGNDSGYVSEYPTKYCIHNDCVDELSNNVPDGVMKDDAKTRVLMRPQKPPITYYWNGNHSFNFPPYGSNAIDIIDEVSGFKSEATVSPVAHIMGVAGNAGIWLAAGSADEDETSGAVAVSTDNGKHWTTFASLPGVILTMVAGPWG